MAVILVPRRRALRRIAVYVLAILLTYQVAKLILPADNFILLAIHFQAVCLYSLFHSTAATDSWIRSSTGPYSVDFESRVGLLIKTGWGTRQRLPAQLEALGLDQWDPDRTIVVADFEQDANTTTGAPVIQDAVGGLMKELAPRGLNKAHRFKKYQSLKNAIDDGDEQRAALIGANVGWELDALKFIWGLRTVYTTLPPKDWYLILDDDSFIVIESLKQLLSHLDPATPYYLGNTVGDYRGRFAHGGSAVVLSRAAVDKLYRENPHVAAEAQINSLTEIWGDKLVATTLQKINIHIDERFNHLFNGESPVDTRIASNRFCSPLVSFHELKKPEDMKALGLAFKEKGARPTVWSDVWDMFGGPSARGFNDRPMRQDHDYVGKLEPGRTKTSENIATAEKCMRLCMRHKKRCLAWKWDVQSKECHTSPWMTVGKRQVGVVSGINGEWAAEMMESC
ncbi:hypothetical protein jhhlp_006809 [Lomentospora prolificans]|uniref:N-acetylgalactosaminide beta-1,3-galactosyltransferase n=1 Tax=Lomentospora prolificans TaxID=41688 RepID=A0A2N3N2R9_9PEZI|nr:hypothetical protein jhhlp_006809 [Lomentospora prolificans]